MAEARAERSDTKVQQLSLRASFAARWRLARFFQINDHTIMPLPGRDKLVGFGTDLGPSATGRASSLCCYLD
jgi:hypothetical protein